MKKKSVKVEESKSKQISRFLTEMDTWNDNKDRQLRQWERKLSNKEKTKSS